ncbi:hypothetical protein B0H14DRAFT_2722097 [Mycena olivaceomarginata]|nr:hypothetical protein B0H14DRAFT_2722097 [Mycena olivaceomarginata]
MPPKTQAALDSLLRSHAPVLNGPDSGSASADVTRPSSVLDATAVTGDASLDIGDDQLPDLELDNFFSPPTEPDKGKGKDTAPPPTTPPPVEERAQPEASTSGHSAPPHPFFRAAGFVPGETVLPSRSTKGQKLQHQHLDSLCAATARLDDRVYSMGKDVGEITDFIPVMQAQINELEVGSHITPQLTQADMEAIADIMTEREGHAIPSLVSATNTLTQNHNGAMGVLKQIDARVFSLENAAPMAAHVQCIHQLEATVKTLASTVAALQARLDGTSVPAVSTPVPPTAVAAPAAPTAFAPPVVPPGPNSPPPIPALAGVDPSLLIAGSKRAREEDADDVRNVRQRAAAVAVPDAFVWTPANPATTVTAPPSGIVSTNTATATAPPWNVDAQGRTNVHKDMSSLFRTVLPSAGRIEFGNCRTTRDNYTICIFETPEYADWVIDAWMKADRNKYAPITAEHPKA